MNAPLQIAAATLVAGVVRDVAHSTSRGLEELPRRGRLASPPSPPIPHTARKGWLARYDYLTANPFALGPDVAAWSLAGRGGELRTLHQIAADVFGSFRRSFIVPPNP